MAKQQAEFTDKGIRALRYDVEIKKVLERRDERRRDRPAPKAVPPMIDYFFKIPGGGRSLILTLFNTSRLVWSVQFYADAKPKRKKLGYFDYSDDKFPSLTAKEAMKAAQKFDVEKALQPQAGTFGDVARKWLEHEVEGRLRSEHELRRHLDVYVLPAWGKKQFAEIRRLQVSELLDGIVKRNGECQADAVLATVRLIMRWQERRDDNYTSPIVAGMRRDKRTPDERRRKRFLDDNEIKLVWEAAEGQFGDIIKLLLLTASRREKVGAMRWEDVDLEAGVWTIPTEKREKGTAARMQLPKLAIDIIARQPTVDDNPYVFATPRGRKDFHFNSWSQRMDDLRESLPATMPRWTPHDLRRTARTILTKLRIDTDVAEAVLGHKKQGIIGVYDQHDYEAEMADALLRLATYIDGVVHPRGGNVVKMSKGKKKEAA